jgi:hypothetical protein
MQKNLVGLLSILLLALSLLGCSSGSSSADWTLPEAVRVGEDTYSMTRKAKTAFASGRKLAQRVEKEAAEFCNRQGKKLEVVSLNLERSPFVGGEDFHIATIVFKAVTPGAAVSSVAPAAPPATPPAAGPMTTDVLYSELLKLDELRQRGILTEEEFAAQKKKVLERAK